MKIPSFSYSHALKVAAIFVVYFFSAKFGLGFDAVSGFATLVWPPTGIALAAVLIFGRSIWPGIFFGAMLVNFYTGAPLFVALGIGIGNTLEGVIGAHLMRRFTGFESSLERIRDVLALGFFGAIIGTLVSASIGVASLWLGGIVISGAYFSTWLAWWVGDILGALIVAPIILVWSPLYFRERFTVKRTIEAALLFCAILIPGSFILGGEYFDPAGGLFILYFPLPILVWAALRFCQQITVTAIFIFSVISIFVTVSGFDPTSGSALAEALLLLQVYIGLQAFTAMLLTAAITEHRKIDQIQMDFLTLASHQLRTPLAGAKWLIETMLAGKIGELADKQKDYLKSIYYSNERMIQLVFEMLNVVRLESGTAIFKKEDILVEEFTKNILEDIKAVSEKKKIKIKIKENAPQAFKIKSDQHALAGILMSFLSNAINYSEEGGEVILEISEKEKKALFSVKDSGIGIPKDEQGLVFRRFYRASNAKAHKPDGTGLGLFIASILADKIGAEIWFESKEGMGSTFYVEV